MASFTATQAVLRNSYYLALQLTLQRANILTSMNPICPIAASLCIRQFGKTLEVMQRTNRVGRIFSSEMHAPCTTVQATCKHDGERGQ